MRVIEVTGEGREIMAGRTTVRASAMIGPENKIASIRIYSLARIITGPGEQYALSMDGQPADLQSVLDSIS